jgi:hypothetical protein
MQGIDDLMLWLSREEAVVVIDEHGHAYNRICKSGAVPAIVFPLLMPNSYLNKKIRGLFAGSNQVKFELDLNGTYRQCLRFVTPFTPSEAETFLHVMGVAKPDVAVFEKATNLVPREMTRLLAKNEEEGAYIDDRFLEMSAKLSEICTRASVDRKRQIALSLRRFFSNGSISSVGVSELGDSFLDLGYIYRYEDARVTRAAPLCNPALLALVAAWRTVDAHAEQMTVRECKRRSDGVEFEDLIWRTLLLKGCREAFELEGQRLTKTDELPMKARLPLRFDEFCTSRLGDTNATIKGQDALIDELNKLADRATRLRSTILYRCPKQCYCMDFLVIKPDKEVYPVQVSLSSFTDHKTVDMGFFGKRNRSENVRRGLRMELQKFVFITADLRGHPFVAKGEGKWEGVPEKAFLVDAWELCDESPPRGSLAPPVTHEQKH